MDFPIFSHFLSVLPVLPWDPLRPSPMLIGASRKRFIGTILGEFGVLRSASRNCRGSMSFFSSMCSIPRKTFFGTAWIWSVFFWIWNLLLCNFGVAKKRYTVGIGIFFSATFWSRESRYTAGFHSKFHDSSTLEILVYVNCQDWTCFLAWLVLGNILFPFSWEFHHPNWRSHISFRGVGFVNHQPDHCIIDIP